MSSDTSAASADTTAPADPARDAPEPPRFVVGVGASAGGLEALGRFFSALTPALDMAFLVVQHLSPDHRSYMVELLSRRSRLPVLQAEHGAVLEAGHIYMLPPRKLLRLSQGRIVLDDMQPERSLLMPIDLFFHSLAEEWKSRSIAVVLSGTGSDGTQGVRSIKEQGGLVLVQSEDSAEFDGMPRSAIGTGLADFIATPDEMPALLLQFVRHPLAGQQDKPVWIQDATQNDLAQVFDLIRTRNGVDFSAYKPSTIQRRIARRMTVQQVDSLAAYAKFLTHSQQESDILFNDLLICVTRFLRDREVWQKLEEDILPELLLQSGDRTPVRAWVAGCSTGEEAYSLAMVLTEVIERLGQRRDFKIFATDVSLDSLAIAGQGIYSKSAVADLPATWLERHFVAGEDGFQVSQALRKAVVFARHDLLNDPPFMRMDLICCRNLLIYLQPANQNKIFQSFGHSLKPEGILLLGSSETTGDQADFLAPVSSKHRIYRRQGPGSRPADLPQEPSRRASEPAQPASGLRLSRPSELRATQDMVARELLREFAPPSLVVNERRELLQVFGSAGEYLQHPDGMLSNNVLRLTAHSIGPALGPALHKAIRDNTEFVYDNVDFEHGPSHRLVRLRVRPLNLAGKVERLFLVVIEDVRERTEVPVFEDFKADRSALQRIRELEQELTYTRDSLQSTTEELESSNEELQASNEELIAANEELQSTNEELQSVNEELHTVNAESQRRIDEVVLLSNDLSNMFSVAQVGAILLSADLRMRRLASAVFSLAGLRPADIGAPVEVLARQLDSDVVMPMLRRVARDSSTEELEVVTPSGAHLMLRATPFLDEMGAADGVVLTLMDVSARSRTLNQLISSENLLRSVINALPCHVAILDATGVITQVNEAWDRFTRDNGAVPGRTYGVGSNYFDSCRQASGPFGEEARTVLQGMLETLTGTRTHFETVYPCHSPQGQRWFHMHVSRLPSSPDGLVVSHTLIESLPEASRQPGHRQPGATRQSRAPRRP